MEVMTVTDMVSKVKRKMMKLKAVGNSVNYKFRMHDSCVAFKRHI